MRKPSVTELLDLLAKPALISWANKQGLAGIDVAAARKQAKTEGLSLHEQIERKTFDDPLHQYNFERFMADKELLDQEVQIETEWFVGRYDARVRWRDQIWMIDYKKASRPTVYFEHRLQLAAYGMGAAADRFGIVAVPGFDMAEAVMRGGRGKHEELVVTLAKAWALRKELGE